MAKMIKKRLLTTIEEIPESKLGELLDFMEFLLEKERNKKKGKCIKCPGGSHGKKDGTAACCKD